MKPSRLLAKELLFILFLSLATMAYFFNRGFNYYDEGHVLHLAQRILQGDIPYRDFHFIYTPGTLYITAGALKLLGVNILSGRILLLLTAVLTSLLLFSIIRELTRKFLPAVLAVLIYLSWAPTHINFPWPVNFAIPTALAYLASILRYEKTGERRSLFAAGALLFLTFFVKHNFGAALFVVNMVIIVTSSKKRKVLLWTFIGFIAPTFIYVSYLLLSGSLIPFVHDMYYYTYLKILKEGMLKTPFVYGTGLSAVIKTLFFLSPAIITAGVGFLLALKKQWRRDDWHIFAFPLSYYLLGIRPTTDFIHLAPLLALAGIPLAYMTRLKNNSLSSLTVLFSLVLIGGGLYTALFRGYYRWETPLIHQTTYIHTPTVKIYVDHKYADILRTLDRYTSTQRKPFYMLIYEYAPTFYTVTGAMNPTSYDLLPSSAISPEVENDVLRQLQSRDVSFVLTDAPLSSRTHTKIIDYIQQHFVKSSSMYEFEIWLNKSGVMPVLVDKGI